MRWQLYSHSVCWASLCRAARDLEGEVREVYTMVRVIHLVCGVGGGVVLGETHVQLWRSEACFLSDRLRSGQRQRRCIAGWAGLERHVSLKSQPGPRLDYLTLGGTAAAH